MAALDIIDGRADGSRLFATVHLDHDEIARLEGADTLAALLAALPGAEAVAHVFTAVAQRTAWRLQRKDKRFGYRGVRLVFAVATNIAAVNRAIAYTLTTVRIREPDLAFQSPPRAPQRSVVPSISVIAMTPTTHR